MFNLYFFDKVTSTNDKAKSYPIGSVIAAEEQTKGKITELIKKEGRDKIIDQINISPMDISIYVNHFRISKWSHMFRINEIIFKFMKQLDELKQAIEEEMEREKVPDEKKSTQFVNIFTGNLDITYELEE